ncbi:hypothetical protein DL991_32445 [Amycolatopsis sp. WAC 01375]|nr:hypothetical protein DL991_32445 [Amycolatopsis sp. WAC 01375]
MYSVSRSGRTAQRTRRSRTWLTVRESGKVSRYSWVMGMSSRTSWRSSRLDFALVSQLIIADGLSLATSFA